jgi:hypothetical protein
MNYKLDRYNRVIVIETGASLPCTYEHGVVTAQDEHSPFVKAFQAWLVADPKNVPLAADPEPEPEPPDVTIADLKAALIAKRLLTEADVRAAMAAK